MREGERERDLSPLLVHSASVCNVLSWARAETQSSEFNPGLPQSGEDKALGSSLLPPRVCKPELEALTRGTLTQGAGPSSAAMLNVRPSVFTCNPGFMMLLG